MPLLPLTVLPSFLSELGTISDDVHCFGVHCGRGLVSRSTTKTAAKRANSHGYQIRKGTVIVLVRWCHVHREVVTTDTFGLGTDLSS
ncbi:hypothetical protein BGZ61DRAFT_467198 [Ilyonectria robusta]|uniref:uncharacterized protein n=1 Tax=Ilyonectria robusta TaxID=1079257 RepID=UPI001E8E26DB|nr:uncharacterized protein BGZ61DRAFT_467198 [Ilyonectria robusta]KAH8654922.1 hypothetical protein BGZ61DRAFT_467198 [Ilyonectria robusta]